MKDLFGVLILASLTFLVIGIFSPKASLFWIKTERTRMKSFSIYLITLFAFFILFGISDDIDNRKFKNNSSQNPKDSSALTKMEEQTNIKPATIDYRKFDYRLPNSDYLYKIEILDIITKQVKNAFETRKDEYSVPEKVDGFLLSIKYSIQNPYDKEMMVPIPNYYYITTVNNEYFSGSTTYSKSCHCNIDNGTTVTDTKGKELWQLSNGKCGNSNYCLKFNAYEKKEFIVIFSDPVIITVRQLIFCGFDRTWKSSDYRYDRDVGIVIDLEKRQVIGEKKL